MGRAARRVRTWLARRPGTARARARARCADGAAMASTRRPPQGRRSPKPKPRARGDEAYEAGGAERRRGVVEGGDAAGEKGASSAGRGEEGEDDAQRALRLSHAVRRLEAEKAELVQQVRARDVLRALVHLCLCACARARAHARDKEGEGEARARACAASLGNRHLSDPCGPARAFAAVGRLLTRSDARAGCSF